MMQGMSLHLLYGTGATVVLATALPEPGFETVESLEVPGLGSGYGYALFIGGGFV